MLHDLILYLALGSTFKARFQALTLWFYQRTEYERL